MPQITRLFLVVMIILGLSGCAHYMTIQQGVELQQSQIDELKLGMTQAQVEYVLGTPNLVDPYHPNTWYYIYTNQPSHQAMTEQKLIVDFQNGKLVKVTGDFKIPSGLN